jgi:GNAT superfamily N-acetyltransferase
MTARGDASLVVREATVEDELDVRRVLDAAMLETDAVSDAIGRGDAFVAVDDDRVVGALVLVPLHDAGVPDAVAGDVGMHVDAVAVRRRRRGRGVGRALVSAALERERRLTVAFDPGIRAFYDALEFDVVDDAPGVNGRLWAERSLVG